MSDGPEPADVSPEVATDLVEYVVVAFPDRAALGSVRPALDDMVRSARIRLLDVVVLAREADGRVEVVEAADVEALGEVAPAGAVGMLSENDLQLAARAVRPGEVGLVLVAEDRWAAQPSAAARAGGGRIVAGERIPAARMEAAVAAVDDEEADDAT
jgi:Family of unknown function (DUF6325)